MFKIKLPENNPTYVVPIEMEEKDAEIAKWSVAHDLVTKALNAGNKENIALKDEIARLKARLERAGSILKDRLHTTKCDCIHCYKINKFLSDTPIIPEEKVW
jgi:hypothetical protein